MLYLVVGILSVSFHHWMWQDFVFFQLLYRRRAGYWASEDYLYLHALLRYMTHVPWSVCEEFPALNCNKKQSLEDAGWALPQLEHIGSRSQRPLWASRLHLTHMAVSARHETLPWTNLWHLQHRRGFGIYSLTKHRFHPIVISCGKWQHSKVTI